MQYSFNTDLEKCKNNTSHDWCDKFKKTSSKNNL